jgi:hypothetical protein
MRLNKTSYVPPNHLINRSLSVMQYLDGMAGDQYKQMIWFHPHRRNEGLKKNSERILADKKSCETILWTCSGPNVLRWPHSDFLTTLETLFQENWSPFCAGGKKILTEMRKDLKQFLILKSLLWYAVFVKTSLCQPACFYNYCQLYILIFNTGEFLFCF